MKTKKVRAAGLLLPLAVLALLWLLSWPASAEEPAVSAALDASGTQINVTLSASAAPADASKVQFPTWSGENGQDDLVWHTAVRAANGDWTAAIPLSSHKGYGSYTIHCYVQSPTKGFYIVGSAKVDVPRVSGSVTTDPTPVGGGTSGSFRVNVTGLNMPGAVKSIQVAVWSSVNGQDDLKWYNAVRSGDNWYVDVNTYNHHYDGGAYQIHAYVRDNRDGFYICGNTQAQVTVDRSKMVLSTVWDPQQNAIVATLSGAYFGSDVKGVLFPTWSKENGQDDLVWHTAEQNTNGDWTAVIPLSSHSGYGVYYVHCYKRTSAGLQIVKGGTVEVSRVKASVSAVSTGDGSGSFRVNLTDLNAPAAVKSIQVAVWSSANGQDDLKWYNAVRSGESWYVDVNTYNHHYDEGAYLIHAYVRDTMGGFYICGNTQTHVTVDRSGEKLSATWNPAKGTMLVQLTGAYTGSDVTGIRFAVWSKDNGQDDLHWYSAARNADGSWSASVPLTNHKGTGDYNIHCYRVTASGQSIEAACVGRVERCYVTVGVQTTDTASGSFRVNLTGATLPETVKTVEVAVWSEAKGQDDLIWTTATKSGSGWYVDVDTGRHIYDDGVYSIHVYVTDYGGMKYCSATAQTTVSIERGAHAVLKTSLDGDWGVLTVRLEGANFGRDVTRVTFPIWTSAGGQDDLVWHEATRGSDGNWSASIDLASHSYENGTYNIHCYQYTGGKAVFVTGISTGITLVRKYQNPSQYYQIQNSISLSGGGYNLSLNYEGLKVAYVKRALGLGNGVGMGGAKYTSSVQSAVSSFQRRAGLPQTGVVDLATWKALGYSETDWTRLGAYVSPIQVNFGSTRQDCIEAMISRAYDYLGNPYIIGASGPDTEGLDCSGLVMQACYAAGLDLSPINPVRHASPGYEYESTNLYASSKLMKVSLANRQRGDLIFYGNRGVVTHVAIYLGNDQVIESWPNRVMVSSMINSSHPTIIGVGRPFV